MKKKKIGSLMTLLILVIGIIFISFPNIKTNEVIKSKDNIYKSSALSLMLETDIGSGIYEKSDDTVWPTSGYELNEEMSKCENGGILSFNDTKQKVVLKTNISDKCYVYFSKISEEDLKVSVIYNGSSNVPTTVGPQATLSCNGATAIYDNQYNRIEISEYNKSSGICNLTYTDRTSKTYLNNKIISLAGTTQGTGQVVNENGYRYEGKDPNNYIWFNNELWRIIGVFDSASHGIATANLTKIVRNESIGGLAWDKSESNDWSKSSLKSLLNGAYYNKQNGTNSGYCYGNKTTVISNCNYTEIGIDLTYRKMIKNVTWYLGGLSRNSSDSNYLNTNTNNVYKYEREATGCGSTPSLTSTTGYIGLMYVSDYGYSVLSSSCSRSTSVNSYSTASCAGASWIYGNGEEWLITPYTSLTKSVFHTSSSGTIASQGSDFVSPGYNVRPTLYLDSTVYIISGTGTMNDPYIIGM